LLANTPVPQVNRLAGLNLWQDSDPQPHQSQRGLDPFWTRLDENQRDPLFEPGLQTSQLPAQLGAPILRLIGQVAATYLIAEGPDGLYLIDQHAAHERVLFEKFIANRQEKMTVQTLLEAAVVEFTPASADLVKENLPLLRSLGFKIEEFGKGAFKIRAVPSILQDASPERILRGAVEDLEVDETPLEKNQEEKIIARVCKKAAVKAGQVLTPEEQKQLLLDLEACSSPRTCPHGRPTMIHLSVDLLERKFGRTGPI
jgi:DNA mismatch repair protein MutL